MKRPPIRFLLLPCILLILSCDPRIPFTVEINSYSTGMDTVTVTFSEAITEITMPNTISFASGTYRFEITDADGNAQDIGLLSHADDTVTIVILGKTASNITGDYSVKIFENEDEDPVELATSEPFAFQAWSGTPRDLAVYQANDVYGVYVFVHADGYDPSSGSPALVGYDGTYFSLFDQMGNLIDATYASPSDEGHRFTFDSSIDRDGIWVRFFKVGVVPPEYHKTDF